MSAQPKLIVIENHILATNTIRRKLMEALLEAGYDLRILTTGSSAELDLARSRGFNVVDVGSSGKNPVGILNYLGKLRKELSTFKPHACLTFTIRPAIWGNLVTGQMNIPTITNITGIGPLFASDSVVYRAARKMYKFVLKKTAKVFFQNMDDMNLFLSNHFIRLEVAERIPGSGIDHEFFKPLPFPHGRDKFVFLFVSRLVKDKGILEYVEAARMLQADFPNVEFRVLGPLWMQNLKANTVTGEELDQWRREGVIRYLGETKDVRPYIADSDSVVLPSYREGTSNILLEASSMERPCITCDVTGCREIIDDQLTGLLCEVKNAKDLADKMKQMLQMPAEQRTLMGKLAREKVKREFDKQLVIDAYLQALEKLAQLP